MRGNLFYEVGKCSRDFFVCLFFITFLCFAEKMPQLYTFLSVDKPGRGGATACQAESTTIVKISLDTCRFSADWRRGMHSFIHSFRQCVSPTMRCCSSVHPSVRPHSFVCVCCSLSPSPSLSLAGLRLTRSSSLRLLPAQQQRRCRPRPRPRRPPAKGSPNAAAAAAAAAAIWSAGSKRSTSTTIPTNCETPASSRPCS